MKWMYCNHVERNMANSCVCIEHSFDWEKVEFYLAKVGYVESWKEGSCAYPCFDSLFIAIGFLRFFKHWKKCKERGVVSEFWEKNSNSKDRIGGFT